MVLGGTTALWPKIHLLVHIVAIRGVDVGIDLHAN